MRRRNGLRSHLKWRDMPGSMPHFLAHTIARARELNLFNETRVRLMLDLGKLPEWLQRLQEPDGFAELTELLGVTIPVALKEFWSRPELVCAWSVAQLDALSEPPAIERWTEGVDYLTFDMHWHSGCAAAVRLDGSDNPPVVLEYEPEKVCSDSFSAYLEDGLERFARHNRRA